MLAALLVTFAGATVVDDDVSKRINILASFGACGEISGSSSVPLQGC
jgi:hypothetical protein